MSEFSLKQRLLPPQSLTCFQLGLVSPRPLPASRMGCSEASLMDKGARKHVAHRPSISARFL